jgi:predicted porin
MARHTHQINNDNGDTMKFNPILPAAMLCGLACARANAQSTVQVYGLVDTGLAYVTNVDAQGHSVIRMPSLTSTFPSRVGFRGTEDLGNGLQAFFVLENGLMMDTGSVSQGGRLFGRQALVGLKGAWGTFTLGRQQNMTYIATIKTDVLGPHLFSAGSIDGYLPNARSDNAIGYQGSFGGFAVGATWSFGRDGSAAGGPAATNCPGEVPGNAKACRQYTGLLGYESRSWGLNTSYDRMYGNTGAAGGLTSSANTDTRITVNGFVVLGTTRIGAGVIDRETRATTGLTESDLYYLGVSQPIGACTIDAQVARRDTKHSTSDVNMLVARLTYSLSKRTAVYTSVGRMENRGASAVALDAGGTVASGMSQNGVMAGLRHTF